MKNNPSNNNPSNIELPAEAGLYEVILRSPGGKKAVWTYRFDPETGEWWQFFGRGNGSERPADGKGLVIESWNADVKVKESCTVERWVSFQPLYGAAGHGWLYLMERNLDTLAEREEVLRLKRAFIEKYAELLKGLVWTVGYLDPEIELESTYFRGEALGAEEIAQQWPGVKWRREKPKYAFDEDKSRDWVGELDGITLRIKKAEEFKPVWIPPDGPVKFADQKGGQQ